ncbi:MAG: peptidoglycan bridge formation glycyltransferase FemA/FemB family protein [Candidatus Vogelbacteria bacterium]|nr:peptidoglycan bridge formation glycyltransferase FemA/FemB family protein [Candidatus Vogelbacteria bacterium]
MRIDDFEFNQVDLCSYNELATGHNLPLPQNAFFGEWHEDRGRQVYRYKVLARESGKVLAIFQILKYPIMLSKSFLYVPHGPVFFSLSEDFWPGFKKFAIELASREGAIFLRFDPHYMSDQDAVLLQKGLVSRAPKYMYDGIFQPKFEWILDTTQTEKAILVGMKKVNRYSVNRAERLGVKIEIVRSNFLHYFDKFYELLQETGKRDSFTYYPRDYYLNIFNNCEKNKNAFLVVAYYKGEILLINIYVVYGTTVYWLFGGSSNSERAVGYTYLAQWEAIKETKRLGLNGYNFGSVTPEDNLYRGYRQWVGFTNFKQRFGGKGLEHGDLYDVVVSKSWYWFYSLMMYI